MYYFSLLKIIKNKKKCTIDDILIEHHKLYGFGNRCNMYKTLKKLYENNKIDINIKKKKYEYVYLKS